MINKQAEINIVPFGKYKDQPVEVMAKDRSYLDWLTAQDWFKQKYPAIHTLIINNFSEPSETPEHNSLQVLFLDDDFVKRFIELVGPRNKRDFLSSHSCVFEWGGADVEIRSKEWFYFAGDPHPLKNVVRVEIKPSVGDDYPAVLRQMRASRCNVLFIECYCGVGATEDEFKKTFAACGIVIIFRHEL